MHGSGHVTSAAPEPTAAPESIAAPKPTAEFESTAAPEPTAAPESTAEFESTGHPGAAAEPKRRPPWWAAHAPAAAAAWAAGYGVLAVSWGLGSGWGRPFGDAQPAPALMGAVAVVCALASAAALATARPWGRARSPQLLGGALWTFAVVLLALAPATLTLDLASVFTAHFGAIEWPPFLVKMFAVVGGALFAAVALAFRRSVHRGCGHCGRGRPGVPEGQGRARWEKVAGYAAVIVPCLGFALPHVLWAMDIPLGITDKGAEELSAPDTAPALWVLAALSAGGAALTLGLVRPWGESVPRWVPLVGGRSVPRLLAMTPPLLVAVSLTPYGVIGAIRMTGHVTGVARLSADRMGEMEPLGYYITYLTFIAWGAALCAAVFLYHFRTRGACSHCGRPVTPATAPTDPSP